MVITIIVAMKIIFISPRPKPDFITTKGIPNMPAPIIVPINVTDAINNLFSISSLE
jgi:hypothetical protein